MIKRPLQYFLASVNIAAAVACPVLDGQYSVWARFVGVSCGLLYWKLSPNIFQTINKLNSRRDELRKILGV